MMVTVCGQASKFCMVLVGAFRDELRYRKSSSMVTYVVTRNGLVFVLVSI